MIWTVFSGERCGPWASCFYLTYRSIHNKIKYDMYQYLWKLNKFHELIREHICYYRGKSVMESTKLCRCKNVRKGPEPPHSLVWPTPVYICVVKRRGPPKSKYRMLSGLWGGVLMGCYIKECQAHVVTFHCYEFFLPWENSFCLRWPSSA